MYEITEKTILNPTVIKMNIKAPLVAKKAQAGQFIILRVDSEGERIPLTVADYDREAGTVTIIFQKVGATTDKLAELNEGDYISDFTGPLGRATNVEGLKKVAVVGGGVGCAIAYPVAKKLHENGCEVHSIVAPKLLGRPKDFVVTVRQIEIASGAGFIIPITGSIMRMPGLPDIPAAEKIDIDNNGKITGLF